MEADQCKIFVGGISRETSEEALKEHFSKYGVVLEAVVAKEKFTGASRRFGFVRFSDAASADKALGDTHEILGRKIEVRKAEPKYAQLQIQQGQPELQRNSGVHEEVNSGSHRAKKIFVGGLSANTTEEEFKNYFEHFGQIKDVVVMHDSATNRPRGFGFVTFDSEDSVENVMQNHFHRLKDKLVEVKRAIPKEEIHNRDDNRNSRFDFGRDSVSNCCRSGPHPLDNSGYGNYVRYVPMLSYSGIHGFTYPTDVCGYGYPSIGHHPCIQWNSPMVPVSGFYLPPYNNASSYFPYMNNGFAPPGANYICYNTADDVNVGAVSSQFSGLKLEVGAPQLDGTGRGGSRGQNQRGF